MSNTIEAPAICTMCGNISVSSTGVLDKTCPLCRGTLRTMNVSEQERGAWEIQPATVCTPSELDAKISGLKDAVRSMEAILEVWNELSQEMAKVQRIMKSIKIK